MSRFPFLAAVLHSEPGAAAGRPSGARARGAARRAAAAVLLALGGCAAEPAKTCTERFPAQADDDYADHDIAGARQTCRDQGGSTCDEEIVSESAAVCLGEEVGLTSDLVRYTGFGYHTLAEDLVWVSSSTSYTAPYGEDPEDGMQVVVSATEGVVIETYGL